MSAYLLRRNIFELQPLEIRRLLTTAQIEVGGILHVVGGNGNDIIAIAGSGSAITVTGVAGTFTNANFTRIQIEGGDGNDTISIGSSVAYSNGSTINGNSGADSITGAGQRDSIRGGLGNDTLLGGNQNDTLQGEDNNDFMDGGGGNDTIDGGSGLDTANYSYRTGNVDADNDGVADDGEGGSGENDNIFTNVEEIIGGAGRDTLTGGGNNDFLGGGGNNDVLTGNGGNDALTAGSGQDNLQAGSGDDILQAQNNDRDTVNGGTGNFDSAQVDTLDVGARDNIFADGVVGNGPSDLDSGYGGGDGVSVGPDLGWDDYAASAVDSQGRIVFVGEQGGNFVAARYTAAGAHDTSFGYGGEATVDFGDLGLGYGSFDLASNVNFGSDGSIYIVGQRVEGESDALAAVAKLDDNGDIVTGFGNLGRVIVDVGGGYNSSSAHDVVVQSDGKAVVAAGAGGQFAAFRLLTDGSLDDSFDNDGIADIPIDAFCIASSIALQTISGQQHILIGGQINNDFGIVRLTPGGALDNSFETDGIVTQSFSVISNLNDLAVAPDGTVVAVGDTTNATFDSDILFDAPNPDLGETEAVIATFGTNGGLITTLGESSTDNQFLVFNAVAIDSQSRIVVSGEDGSNFVVARYILPDLTQDQTFSSTNYVSIDLGLETFDAANSVGVLADGKIVLGGITDECGDGCLVFSGLRLNGGPTETTNPNEAEVTGVESFFDYDDLHNNPGFFDNLSESAQRYMLWQPDGDGVIRIELEDDWNNNIVINFTRTHGQDGYVSVNVDGLAVYCEPEDMTRIEIYAGAGDDTIIVDKKVTIPLLIDGGEGNDNIEGGDAHDILLGGPGSDNLNGGQGRNILIGGTGTDNLKGGQKEDIIIAGTTVHDDDVDALLAIDAEWNSANAFNTRVNFISNGGGLNGAAILDAGVTVFDDAAKDIVDGQGNKDWLFVHLSGATADQLKGAQGGVLIELI
jgi:uncharacterized delta-60 repeat protein